MGSKKRKDWFIDYISADPDCPLCTNIGIFMRNKETFDQPPFSRRPGSVGISPAQVSFNDPKCQALSLLHIIYNIYRVPPFHFTDYTSTLQEPSQPPLLSSPSPSLVECSITPTPTHVLTISSPPLTISPHILPNIPIASDAPSNVTSILTTPFAFRPPYAMSSYTHALRSQGLKKRFFFFKV
jgi:hypothetical protein